MSIAGVTDADNATTTDGAITQTRLPTSGRSIRVAMGVFEDITRVCRRWRWRARRA